MAFPKSISSDFVARPDEKGCLGEVVLGEESTTLIAACPHLERVY